MKAWLPLCLLTACASTASDSAPQAPSRAESAPANPFEAAPSPNALDQHRWLQRFVGEWEVQGSSVMMPGAEPVRWQSKESVRPVGGLWVIIEGNMGEGSQRFTSIMTLGYDAQEGRFVGTWVDSMQTMLWTYEGTLDADQRVLTLRAEGPAMGNPKRDALYRDVIEWVDDDHRRMTSSMQGVDGSWNEYMSMEVRRVR